MRPNTLDKYIKPLNNVAFRYQIQNSNEIRTQFFVDNQIDRKGSDNQQKSKKDECQQNQKVELSALNQFNFEKEAVQVVQKQKKDFIEINQFLADSFKDSNSIPIKNNENYNKIKIQVKLQEIQKEISSNQKLPPIEQIQQINYNQSNFQDSDDENEQSNLDRKLVKIQDDSKENTPQGRRKKGLTFISSKVSELLRQKRKIKSNEIISLIIQEQFSEHDPKNKLSNDGTTNRQKQELYIKQKKNIKRRIYDSLNVMVALGIIKKVKHQYVYTQAIEESVVDQQELLEKRKDYCQKLQRECQELQEKLNVINNTYTYMKTLRKQNLQTEQKIGISNDNTRSNVIENTIPPYFQVKINFPFVILHNSNQEMSVEFMKEQTQCKKNKDWIDMVEDEQQQQIKYVCIQGKKIELISDLDSAGLVKSLMSESSRDQNQNGVLQQFQMLRKLRQQKEAQMNFNTFSFRVNSNSEK